MSSTIPDTVINSESSREARPHSRFSSLVERHLQRPLPVSDLYRRSGPKGLRVFLVAHTDANEERLTAKPDAPESQDLVIHDHADLVRSGFEPVYPHEYSDESIDAAESALAIHQQCLTSLVSRYTSRASQARSPKEEIEQVLDAVSIQRVRASCDGLFQLVLACALDGRESRKSQHYRRGKVEISAEQDRIALKLAERVLSMDQSRAGLTTDNPPVVDVLRGRFDDVDTKFDYDQIGHSQAVYHWECTKRKLALNGFNEMLDAISSGKSITNLSEEISIDGKVARRLADWTLGKYPNGLKSAVRKPGRPRFSAASQGISLGFAEAMQASLGPTLQAGARFYQELSPAGQQSIDWIRDTALATGHKDYGGNSSRKPDSDHTTKGSTVGTQRMEPLASGQVLETPFEALDDPSRRKLARTLGTGKSPVDSDLEQVDRTESPKPTPPGLRSLIRRQNQGRRARSHRFPDIPQAKTDYMESDNDQGDGLSTDSKTHHACLAYLNLQYLVTGRQARPARGRALQACHLS